MTDSKEPRRWLAPLCYLLLPIASISIFFLTRHQNRSAHLQPIFEAMDTRSNHQQTFRFDCVVADEYEIGFEFLRNPSVRDFEKLMYERSSPLPIEWTVRNRDSTIAQGSFKEFSFRELSLRKVRVVQKLAAIRTVPDLRRRILRGVGKFTAVAGESYQIQIRTGQIPTDISKTDPRFLIQRNRRLIEREVFKSAGLLGFSVLLFLFPLGFWGYRRIQNRFSIGI